MNVDFKLYKRLQTMMHRNAYDGRIDTNASHQVIDRVWNGVWQPVLTLFNIRAEIDKVCRKHFTINVDK